MLLSNLFSAHKRFKFLRERFALEVSSTVRVLQGVVLRDTEIQRWRVSFNFVIRQFADYGPVQDEGFFSLHLPLQVISTLPRTCLGHFCELRVLDRIRVQRNKFSMVGVARGGPDRDHINTISNAMYQYKYLVIYMKYYKW